MSNAERLIAVVEDECCYAGCENMCCRSKTRLIAELRNQLRENEKLRDVVRAYRKENGDE